MSNADVAAAGNLLRYALSPKERPGGGTPYRELLDRFETDQRFAELVRVTAEALGLYVRGATAVGLILTGDTDGPFRVTLDNSGLPIRSGTSRLNDRLLYGLVLVAVAAYVYPNGDALVDTVTRPVRPGELERFITRHVEAAANAVDVADRDEFFDDSDGQLGDAARRWLGLPEVLRTDRGALRRDCRRAYVASLLTFLVDTGRARREPTLDDERGETYMLNDRFRLGVVDVVELIAFDVFASASRNDDSAVVPTSTPPDVGVTANSARADGGDTLNDAEDEDD